MISGVTQPSVIRIVERRAKEMDCRLERLDKEIKCSIRSRNPISVFDFGFGNVAYKKIKTDLIGDHQVRNASLAITAVLKMRKYGIKVTRMT